MLLTNFKINILLTRSPSYATDNTTGVVTFELSNTKIHIQLVPSSPQNNRKLLQQQKSGFQVTTNCSKYQSNYFQSDYRSEWSCSKQSLVCNILPNCSG